MQPFALILIKKVALKFYGVGMDIHKSRFVEQKKRGHAKAKPQMEEDRKKSAAELAVVVS